MRGSTAVGGYVVALGVLFGAFALVVADPDDGRAWLVAGIGALGVLILPSIVLLILNVCPPIAVGEVRAEPNEALLDHHR